MSDQPATPCAATSMLAPRHEASIWEAAAIANDEELLNELAIVWHQWTLWSTVYATGAAIAVGTAAVLAGVSLGVVFIGTAVGIGWFGMRALERELSEHGIAPHVAREVLMRSLFVHESYEPQLYLPGKRGIAQAKRAMLATLKQCAAAKRAR